MLVVKIVYRHIVIQLLAGRPILQIKSPVTSHKQDSFFMSLVLAAQRNTQSQQNSHSFTLGIAG